MPVYVELHAHSCFSLLDGASTPEALVKQAALLRMPALALTDHDALYGAVRFDRAAQSTGVCPIFGAELTIGGGQHLTVLVENEQGWQNLCWLVSRGRHNAPKGNAVLPREALDGHTGGLLALSGCRKGAVASALLCNNWQAARAAAAHLIDLFGGRVWIELQHHARPEDDRLVYQLVALSRQLGLGYVATNNVHYAIPEAQCLQDVLTCIRHGKTLDTLGSLRRPNSEYYLKSAQQMQRSFSAYPAALSNTLHVAERCNFSLRYGLQDLPTFPAPTDADSYLRQLCEAALPQRIPDAASTVSEKLRHELALIHRAGLANYFLIVWDLVRFSREHGIRCQGRGSAANSLVAYLLGISPINPLAHDLVFERFLSEERKSAPDIDIDFQADRREEVIQYVYQRYGHDHAAMACTLVTFRTRSAIREVGKALGLPPELVERRANEVHQRNKGGLTEPQAAEKFVYEAPIWQQFDALCKRIVGLPRHLGIHNGGMVITGSPLAQRVPTEPATMPDRVVIQWDKDSLEDAGLIKIDILGLRMLSVVAEAAAFGAAPERPIDLDRLSFDDPAVYQMIAEADTVGVFQVESRAQAQVLPRLRPRSFSDIVVSISLIRPGPIIGNMVHPYLRRRLGEEPVRYTHPILKPALAETLGVILWQEQVLKVARDMGRLTAGQGELLRRALGKNAEEDIATFHDLFAKGAAENGVQPHIAAEVFRQLTAFGGYSFPKSHAAAFAVLVYQSAWLKYYFPAAFYVGLLRNQPMGFWSPAVIVTDARRHGIMVLPVDINRSQSKCVLEDGAIRIGFDYVNGFGERAISALEAARGAGPFASLEDFCRRVLIPARLIQNLILVGATGSWGIPRRGLLWELGELVEDDNPLRLRFERERVELPPLTRAEMLYAEFELLGLSVGDHVMALYRPMLPDVPTSRSLNQLPNKSNVTVAGQVVMHQSPPTAKGHHFITLEDEEGMMNIIVRPDVYAEYGEILSRIPLLLVHGEVQKKEAVVNVVLSSVEPLIA